MFESWRETLKRGITSYWEVLTDLDSARRYHEHRALAPFSDGVSSKPFPAIEIPLLWGTF